MSCSWRAWVRKPSREVSASSSVAVPSRTTCRASSGQWKTPDARGLAARSRVLVVGVEEWKRTPVSIPVTRTVRACGVPSASAVANVIVWCSPSVNQRASTASGSPASCSGIGRPRVHQHHDARLRPDLPEPVVHAAGVGDRVPGVQRAEAAGAVLAQLHLDGATGHVEQLRALVAEELAELLGGTEGGGDPEQ